jgi:hypothetical protein
MIKKTKERHCEEQGTSDVAISNEKARDFRIQMTQIFQDLHR